MFNLKARTREKDINTKLISITIYVFKNEDGKIYNIAIYLKIFISI